MLQLAKCRPGHIVGRAIVADNGSVVVEQYACLTRDTIAELEADGHSDIVLEVDESFDAKLERIDETWLSIGLEALAKRGVPPDDRMPALRRQAASDLNIAYRSMAVAALFGDRENVRGVITRAIVSEFKPKVLAALVEIKMADASLYVHALASTVAAALIARAIGVPSHRTGQLIAGTLLQDIGEIYLPDELDASDRLRFHPLLGYRLLRASGYVDALSAHVALEHHEFTDGTGEPRGVYGQNSLSVSRWALPPLPTLVGEIAAVANIYALKTGRGRDGGLSPDKAVGHLRGVAGQHLNKAIVAAFLKATPIYPKNARVVIRGGDRDGFRGKVSVVNPSHFDRPLVTLDRDRSNSEIRPVNFDLKGDKGSRIEVRAW
jgi:HD-GYP domain-containing protein (c-di-GMP phosphodiesterase class II)